jgi:hypothetical protein
MQAPECQELLWRVQGSQTIAHGVVELLTETMIDVSGDYDRASEKSACRA